MTMKSTKTLQLLATLTAPWGSSNFYRWYPTNAQKTCAEYYVVINLTSAASQKLKVHVNSTASNVVFEEQTASVNHNHTIVIPVTNSAVINNNQISRQAMNSNAVVNVNEAGIDYLSFRCINDPVLSGTVQIWGWM